MTKKHRDISILLAGLTLKRAFKLFALLGLIVLASVSIFRSSFHGHRGIENLDSPVEAISRTPLPQFTILNNTDTAEKLSPHLGKVTILNFWASWCGPCLEELPVFSHLLEEYKDRGLSIVAINVDLAVNHPFVEQFWNSHNLHYLNFFDSHQSASDAIDLQVLPTSIVLDQNAKVVFRSEGFNDWSHPKASQFIESLLAE